MTTGIKAGARVTAPRALGAYADMEATVLRTEPDTALLEWTEADGSRTAKWVFLTDLEGRPAVFLASED